MAKPKVNKHFLKLNHDKTQIIAFSTPTIYRNLTVDSINLSHGNLTTTVIPLAEQVKYLGFIFDKHLSLSPQINNVCSNCYFYLKKISSIRSFISQSNCESLVHALISSRLDYCNSLYFGTPKFNISKLQRVQNAAARLVLSKSKRDSISACFRHLHWLNIEQRVSFKLLMTLFKRLHGIAPILLSNCLLPSSQFSRHSAYTFNVTFNESKYGRRAFSYCAPRLWNCLPLTIRCISSLPMFKTKLKTYIFSSYEDMILEYSQYAKLLP